ncbi:MAG: TonB-dependent receptor [Cyanobacteria bacterium]|nr:TonB-dependent receptor [Cyanobacteriota bacterium]
MLAPVAADAETFRGTVKDESGGVVAGASVTVLTARQAVVATTVSDPTGSFTIADLPPGDYVVQIEAAGFGLQRIAATVRANAPPVSIVLDVDGVRERVTVTSSPGIAQDSATAVQGVSVISQEQLDQRVHTVVAEAVAEEPGVHLQRTSPSMAGIFVRGLTGNKVNVYVDGVRYSNGAQRGGVNTFLNLIDPSAIGGVEVVHGPNSAEYGSDALGGTVQFLTRTPMLAASGSTAGGEISLNGTTTYEGGGGNAALSWGTSKFGLFAGGGGRKAGELRPGGGIDSHAAATRFLGIPSNAVMGERLPNTGFNQFNGMVKANWTPSSRTQVVSTYTATRQDKAHRYDQELGGDGNLISELNDLTLDLFYARLERSGIGWFDHGAFTYSVNSQREERVNQGGQGSNTAAIAYEPERTTSHGVQAALSKSMSRSSFQAGGDMQFEKLVSDAFNINPVSGTRSVRRPRVPSNATFAQGGVFAQMGFDAVPDRLRLAGAVRAGYATYAANASDAPVSGGRPLWPDDSFSTNSVTFRAGAIFTPPGPRSAGEGGWTFVVSASRGFRAPHMTDLGTLGLTGSGYEIAAPDVEGRGAFIGTTADATAVATGDPVRQLRPESSFNVDGSVRFRSSRASAELTVFVNRIYDNIQKQTLILPQGAVGSLLGTDPIISQNANGAVFVAAAATPVLVRANFDNARSWGLEHQGRYQIAGGLSLRTVFTYYNVKDTRTNLAPNIEGGVPAPDGYVILQYAPGGGKWWVQPYLHAAAEQSNLSTLDLGDRRIAAPRSRNNIQAFFRNGATNRGWVSPGADGTFGNADDILIATGETLAQVQDRVLGAGVNSGVLFSAVPGYVTFGVRAGLKFGKHELLIDAENLNDKNYRGISWGIDAPGRGITVKYVARF